MRKWIWVIIVVVVLLATGAAWFLTRPKATTVRAGQSYALATITRGSLESVVSSSGTLSAVSTVSILSQMNGRAEKVHAHYNDHVKKGQVLAELNTDMLRVQEKQSKASVRKAQANYRLQLLDMQNKTQLAGKSLISDYDLKTSQTTLEVYAAELSAAQAALDVIQTQLNQYALITSPIDGIVIDRNVDVGQSVLDGSSPNATSLFKIAGDLSSMEIKAEVDELDIGSITTGQRVRFTVEAHPGATFYGKVRGEGGERENYYIRQALPRASPQDPPRAARSNPRGGGTGGGVSPGTVRPGSVAASRRRKKSLPCPPIFLDIPSKNHSNIRTLRLLLGVNHGEAGSTVNGRRRRAYGLGYRKPQEARRISPGRSAVPGFLPGLLRHGSVRTDLAGTALRPRVENWQSGQRSGS